MRQFIQTSLTLLFLLISINGLLFAQAPLPAQNLQVHLKVSPTTSQLLREIPPDSISSAMASLPLEVNFIITLADTINLDSVAVRLGSTLGGNERFEGTFPAHGTGTLATGKSFERKGNTLLLKLGQFQGVNQYFAEVRTLSVTKGISGPLRKTGP